MKSLSCAAVLLLLGFAGCAAKKQAADLSVSHYVLKTECVRSVQWFAGEHPGCDLVDSEKGIWKCQELTIQAPLSCVTLKSPGAAEQE